MTLNINCRFVGATTAAIKTTQRSVHLIESQIKIRVFQWDVVKIKGIPVVALQISHN